MNSEVFDRVRTVAADVLGIQRSQISGDSGPQELERWDSISHVSIVVALEEQFGVAFAPEEISAMRSVAVIAELLSRKIDGNSH